MSDDLVPRQWLLEAERYIAELELRIDWVSHAVSKGYVRRGLHETIARDKAKGLTFDGKEPL